VRHDDGMPTHVALLRGINVGGRNRIAMPALRETVSALGHTEVSTYIQSGNVLFTPLRKAPSSRLATELEHAIDDAFGIRPRVAVLSRTDLARAVRSTPYPDEANPKYVHAIVFGDPPDAEMRASVADALAAAQAKGSPDEATFVGDVLYLHTPAGLGRSELAAQLGKARGPLSSKGSGTARNWSTVTKLLELCDG
jgi:uncharacterized protein (DUF1697 family)